MLTGLMSQYRVNWRANLINLTNIWIQRNMGSFRTRLGTVAFARKISYFDGQL
jgi:hypothetical protein